MFTSVKVKKISNVYQRRNKKLFKIPSNSNHLSGENLFPSTSFWRSVLTQVHCHHKRELSIVIACPTAALRQVIKSSQWTGTTLQRQVSSRKFRHGRSSVRIRVYFSSPAAVYLLGAAWRDPPVVCRWWPRYCSSESAARRSSRRPACKWRFDGMKPRGDVFCACAHYSLVRSNRRFPDGDRPLGSGWRERQQVTACGPAPFGCSQPMGWRDGWAAPMGKAAAYTAMSMVLAFIILMVVPDSRRFFNRFIRFGSAAGKVWQVTHRQCNNVVTEEGVY